MKLYKKYKCEEEAIHTYAGVIFIKPCEDYVSGIAWDMLSAISPGTPMKTINCLFPQKPDIYMLTCLFSCWFLGEVYV